MLSGAIAIAPGPRLGQQVLTADGVVVRYGERELFRDLSFDLPPGATGEEPLGTDEDLMGSGPVGAATSMLSPTPSMSNVLERQDNMTGPKPGGGADTAPEACVVGVETVLGKEPIPAGSATSSCCNSFSLMRRWSDCHPMHASRET